jgi:hypothetical protein
MQVVANNTNTGKVKRTATLQLMKSTSGTYVYHEEGHEKSKHVFPTIYVQKHNFVGTPPDKITVTMEWEPV